MEGLLSTSLPSLVLKKFLIAVFGKEVELVRDGLPRLIWPSLKGGLYMGSGQKKTLCSMYVGIWSKFEIRNVGSSNLALGMGNQ